MDTTVSVALAGNFTISDAPMETIFSTLVSNVTNITAAPAASGGDAGKAAGSTRPQCFYWDLLVRILLNSIFAVLGILGNT